MNSIARWIILSSAVVIALIAAWNFRPGYSRERLYPSSALSGIRHLSDYLPRLKNAPGDTEIYEFDSGVPGGSLLVLGGTHADEPAGYLAAYVLIENFEISAGKIFVIPCANRSAMTHTNAGEAHPNSFHVETPTGARRFRFGCRFTNPIHQWPDPEVYLHHPSRQELSGVETRNLNRSYPGRANGNFTEQIAFAITEFVKREKISMVIDLHEASLEYPVINALVAHERAMDVAALAALTMQSEGVDIALEPSPAEFHGLSHRELGDATETLAFLMETANVVQGRLRGRVTSETILNGQDNMYARAAAIGKVRVSYDSSGIPIELRVGRHLAGIRAIVDAYNITHANAAIGYGGIPSYNDILTNKLGYYLAIKHEMEK